VTGVGHVVSLSNACGALVLKLGWTCVVRPSGMSAEKHRKQFEKEMRVALHELTMKHACYSDAAKRYHAMKLNMSENDHYIVSVDVKHVQSLEELEGYRNIRWYLQDEVIDVWIDDVCYSEDNGNKGQDYVKCLKLTMSFTDQGVETTGKRIFHGPFLKRGDVWDDDKDFTYQGHQINTGAEVIELVKHLGDMTCFETLV